MKVFCRSCIEISVEWDSVLSYKVKALRDVRDSRAFKVYRCIRGIYKVISRETIVWVRVMIEDWRVVSAYSRGNGQEYVEERFRRHQMWLGKFI